MPDRILSRDGGYRPKTAHKRSVVWSFQAVPHNWASTLKTLLWPQPQSTWHPYSGKEVSRHIPHSPRLGGFKIFISKAWIASISRSWQNQDTCKIPYNTLDSQKVPKSTVKLTLPLQEMYDTNNIKLKGGKKGDTGFPKIHFTLLQPGSTGPGCRAAAGSRPSNLVLGNLVIKSTPNAALA